MRVVPAIDLLGGKVVRLQQGRYDAATVYDDDPVGVARRFRTIADRLHVVDLEGAKAGRPVQQDTVKRIIDAFEGGEVQVGGGVRSAEALEGYLALGARRVVLGTAAVSEPELVRELARRHPGVLVVAVDAHGGLVATEGWTSVSRLRAVDVLSQLEGESIAAVLYTDIARDGMGSGPNMEATGELARVSPFPIIASGGVKTAEHLRALAMLPNVEGAIVGTALYDGSLTLAEAAEAAAGR